PPVIHSFPTRRSSDLFETGAVVAIQDMGAAGLISSSSEMASRAGTGVEIDVRKVPAKEEGMEPWEFLLSESQERMLVCVKQGREDRKSTRLNSSHVKN